MTGRDPEALARLRKIRDALGEDGAPNRVNLRDYAEPGSPAWDAFVEASGLPGHKVRRATMLARINQAIDALTAQLLGIEAPPAATPPPVAPGAHEIDLLAEVVNETLGEPRRIERQRLRRLTPDGIRYARAFLADLRENPSGPIEPPRDLLFGDAYSERFVGEVEVERRPFRTRREAAEYLAPRLEPIRPLVADHAGVWSWLGMFYFADIARVSKDGNVWLSRLDDQFIMGTSDGSAWGARPLHYLWSAWRLYEQFRHDHDSIAFLLDQDLTERGYLTTRIFNTNRIFNSAGIVPLVIRLYTQGKSQKPLLIRSTGGLQHLIRVLDQLERTYDVYGMEPEALLAVLPDEFRAWDGGPGPQAAA